MFRVLMVLSLLLTLCPASMSQDNASFKVSTPPVAKRDQPVRINHPPGIKIQAIYADLASGVVTWSYLSEDHFQRADTYTVFAAPPGDYLVTTGDSTILKIIEEGGPRPVPTPGPPKPNPQPSPSPYPSPQPKMKVSWAVWVYEQVDAAGQVSQTNTRLSVLTRQFLDLRGIKFAAYDDDQESAKAEPFRKVASSLPALILLDESGKSVSYPAPKSVDELKSIIKEVTGE